eukprot:Seg500.5 transcript_id=Seg500.5/GoldUCD/mRNA.D3Y31 product="DNA transposase THAP9" pseudo=true protein_id=Seg500.5/GoldUCD/D3Y31
MAEHDWENFFQSLIQVLDEAENVTTEQQREITGLHLEDGVSALQQVISLVPGESESGQVLATLLRNFRLLLASWRNVSSDRCSNVAIYSLDAPPMAQSVNAGRPKFEISEEVLLQFRSIGFTWTQIAEMLLVSRWTIRRRVVEFGVDRKKVRFGSLPTQNLPKRSFEKKPEPRSSSSSQIEKRKSQEQSEKKPKRVYKDFDFFSKSVSKLKLNVWDRKLHENRYIFEKKEMGFIACKIKVIVDESLDFSVAVFGWSLPDDHPIYKHYKRNVRHDTIASILGEHSNLTLCQGLYAFHDGLNKHSVAREIDPFGDDCDGDNETQVISKEYFRSKNCKLLSEKAICDTCIPAKSRKKKCKKVLSPAKAKAPVSRTRPEKLKLALQKQRLECKDLKKRIEKMKLEIENNSMTVDEGLERDIATILEGNNKKHSPFMKLFWRQQQEAWQANEKGIRYHPMIIRFSLSIAAKSPSAYEELRSSGVLKLPSKRTLRDYRNVVKPKQGFNKQIIEELTSITTNLSNVQRYIVLMFDEVKIKNNLVWDKHSGQLIGFMDLGDPDLNFVSAEKEIPLATHMLVIYLRGICTDLKYPFGNFATTAVTSFQLLPIFWSSVFYLEKACNLWVIAVVSDGASANRKFYKLHRKIGNQAENEVTYRVYAKHRQIYFFADPPHLLKTSRNCLHNSGYGLQSRLMWNDGKTLMWSHIMQLYNDDLIRGLHLAPKLTHEHVHLNPYSKMKVYLATQVLSYTVAKVLFKYYPSDYHATAEFCEMLDLFFDCCNVRNRVEHARTRKEFRKPYCSQDDERFSWLKEKFIPYLETWKKRLLGTDDVLKYASEDSTVRC